jgi:cobalt/nickel transport system permease protein
MVDAQYLDHYSYLDSPVHRFPAHIKLAVTFGLIFVTLIITWWIFQLVIAVMLATLLLMSRLPLIRIFRRMHLVWRAILVICLIKFFHADTSERAGVFWDSLKLYSIWLAALVLLFCTTRFTDIMQVLTALGVPRSIVSACWAIYRYLYAFSAGTDRFLYAYKARTPRSTWKQKLRQMPHLLTSLLVRSGDRARRIHAGMAARSLSDSGYGA